MCVARRFVDPAGENRVLVAVVPAGASRCGHRTDCRTPPTLLEDQYLDTAYGEGLVRLYMASKGSMLTEIKGGGGQPTVADTFDVLIGVMVARQKNDFIYAIAEDDGEGGAAEGTKNVLTQKIQSFFASIALTR